MPNDFPQFKEKADFGENFKKAQLSQFASLEKASLVTASRFLRNMFLIQLGIYGLWILGIFLMDPARPWTTSLFGILSNGFHIVYYIFMRK